MGQCLSAEHWKMGNREELTIPWHQVVFKNNSHDLKSWFKVSLAEMTMERQSKAKVCLSFDVKVNLEILKDLQWRDRQLIFQKLEGQKSQRHGEITLGSRSSMVKIWPRTGPVMISSLRRGGAPVLLPFLSTFWPLCLGKLDGSSFPEGSRFSPASAEPGSRALSACMECK